MKTITNKQLKALHNMIEYVDKGSDRFGAPFEMESLWTCEFEHIKWLVKTGQIKKFASTGYSTQKVFAFLSDSISKVEDDYIEAMP